MTKNPSLKGLQPALSPKNRFVFNFTDSRKNLLVPAPPPPRQNTPRVFHRPNAPRPQRLVSKIELNPSRPRFTPYFNETTNLVRISDQSTHYQTSEGSHIRSSTETDVCEISFGEDQSNRCESVDMYNSVFNSKFL